ncbi:MAG: hypothetical protein ACXW3D_01920 [Caulobacteraceae bacterium]
MPEKHPNTHRWGGPGASHEDRSKPEPDPMVKDATDPDRMTRHSKVSGGGGEEDVHHSHDPHEKRDFESH